MKEKQLNCGKNEYNCFEFRYIENDKGLCIIKKIS